MKKLYGLFIVICCVVVCMQSTLAQGLNIGIRTGVGLSSYIGNPGENFDDKYITTDDWNSEGKSIVGFYVGLSASIGLSDRFSVQPEVLYTAQGSVVENPATYGADQTIVYTYNVSYLRVPLLAKYYVAGEVGSGFSLYVGPEVGFKIMQGGKLNIGGSQARVVRISAGNIEIRQGDVDFEDLTYEKFENFSTNIEKFNVKPGEDIDHFKRENKEGGEVDLLNALDLGLVVGFDYDFDLGLSAGLRYNTGFLNVFNTDIPYHKDTTFKNSTLSLSVAYLFNL